MTVNQYTQGLENADLCACVVVVREQRESKGACSAWVGSQWMVCQNM